MCVAPRAEARTLCNGAIDVRRNMLTPCFCRSLESTACHLLLHQHMLPLWQLQWRRPVVDAARLTRMTLDGRRSWPSLRASRGSVPLNRSGFKKQEKNDPTIQPPAKLRPPQTTAPTAILDYHGCKKSKIALGAVAGRGSGQSGSATSGCVAHAITI